MEERLFAMRLHRFNERMYWRRLREGIPEPEWPDWREDEIFALMTAGNDE